MHTTHALRTVIPAAPKAHPPQAEEAGTQPGRVRVDTSVDPYGTDAMNRAPTTERITL